MAGTYIYNEATGGYDYVDDGSPNTSPATPADVGTPTVTDTGSTTSTDTPTFTDTSSATDPAGALAAYYAQNPHSASANQPGAAAQAANATGAANNGTEVPGVDGSTQAGVFSRLMQGMGIQDKAGNIDYSDPKVLDRIMKAVAIGGNILTTLQGPQNRKTASELSSQFKNPYDKFSAPAQTAADAYYGSAYKRHDQQAASTMASPIVAGKRYAEGGGVEPAGDFDSRGPLSLVRGADSGQADTVKAHLSHGEYVFDADTVAALGDGNNEAGANILDKWREELRRQKRSAPIDKIPPKAKAPSHYLGKVK
jgi:hypothetical protein